MGINIGSKMMVGLWNSTTKSDKLIEEILNLDMEEDYYEELEELGMSVASPYFDSDFEKTFIGFDITPPKNLSPLALASWCDAIQMSASKFEKLTGLVADLKIVNDVT